MIEINFVWRAPPSSITLAQHDIHIWYASLNQPAPCVHELALTLSSDEKARAKRFYFEKDRNHYIVGRGILRSILGRYLNTEPNLLKFCYGEHGKPYLVELCAVTSLSFNLSHSQEIVLYAIAQGKSIGIDLEHIRAIPDVDQIVARFFSEKEQRAFYAFHPEERQKAFFKVWTCKEAYLKAIGVGLNEPLNNIEVTISPGEAPPLLNAVGNEQDTSRWSLLNLSSPSGYIATLVTEGEEYQLTYW